MWSLLGTFFEFNSGDVSTALGYSGNLVSDFKPILTIIVGIAVGVFVIYAIIGAIKH